MAAATCQAQYGNGASVSWASAEGGAKFNREDTLTGTTPVPIPTATGTKFSWIKHLCLAVTGTGTTAITNRRISMSTTTATGLALYWIINAVASYAQASGTNMPADSGSQGATPTRAGSYPASGTYTAVTTTPAQYDNTSVATSGSGPNGAMVLVVLGVSDNFAGGPGSATTLPNLTISK